MKTLKIFLLIAAMAALSSSAFAQTDNITASANVLATITVSGDQNLDFGTFPDGNTASQALSTGNEANLGLFTVSGQTAGSDVDFTLNAPNTLTPSGSFDALPYAPTATLATALDAGTGSAFTFDGSNDGTVNVATVLAGNYYVYVGGTVDASNGANNYSGSYSGTITLTVSYN